MKKHLFLCLTAATLLFASCDIVIEDRIYDYVTASMIVHITDAEGTNLLDTTQAGNLFEKGMGTLSYSSASLDKSQPIRTLSEYLQSGVTRMNIGPWVGAVLCKDDKGEPVLFIGEFSEGADGELTLEFADGNSVSISYSHVANLMHRLQTRCRITDKPKGMNVSVDFSTSHGESYLRRQE